MVKNGLSNLGVVFLFLVVVLVPCSIDYVLPSPKELIPTNGWRRKLIPVRSSVSRRAAIKGAPPSPPPSAISMKLSAAKSNNLPCFNQSSNQQKYVHPISYLKSNERISSLTKLEKLPPHPRIIGGCVGRLKPNGSVLSYRKSRLLASFSSSSIALTNSIPPSRYRLPNTISNLRSDARHGSRVAVSASSLLHQFLGFKCFSKSQPKGLYEANELTTPAKCFMFDLEFTEIARDDDELSIFRKLERFSLLSRCCYGKELNLGTWEQLLRERDLLIIKLQHRTEKSLKQLQHLNCCKANGDDKDNTEHCSAGEVESELEDERVVKRKVNIDLVATPCKRERLSRGSKEGLKDPPNQEQRNLISLQQMECLRATHRQVRVVQLFVEKFDLALAQTPAPPTPTATSDFSATSRHSSVATRPPTATPLVATLSPAANPASATTPADVPDT
ncbi:unnamed protein product [Microthlaspi erraticum]|uniref:Uncharacterized protein n=1 Tax=Microthlaspi erraticum TaxID=1685480 RepID=A0A6D2KA47_9BRAS|nr:unnamed protein product [Microthlaspi erraticum]